MSDRAGGALSPKAAPVETTMDLQPFPDPDRPACTLPRSDVPPDGAQPLTLDEVRPLLAPLRTARAILLAVSGGPDSVALMRLAAEVAQSDPAFPPLAVATVDHGLRDGSRVEADDVAATATALGLDAHILTWTGDKPQPACRSGLVIIAMPCWLIARSGSAPRISRPPIRATIRPRPCCSA